MLYQVQFFFYQVQLYILLFSPNTGTVGILAGYMDVSNHFIGSIVAAGGLSFELLNCLALY